MIRKHITRIATTLGAAHASREKMKRVIRARI